jgi:hypothetical protein
MRVAGSYRCTGLRTGGTKRHLSRSARVPRGSWQASSDGAPSPPPKGGDGEVETDGTAFVVVAFAEVPTWPTGALSV